MNMLNDDDIVSAKATAAFHSALIGSKARGDTVRTTLAHARHLIKLNCLDEKTLQLVQSKEKKPAGPTERKPAGPGETNGSAPAKKLSGAPTAGRSIDTASSSAPGRGILSSSLAADRVLRQVTDLFASQARSIGKAVRLR